MTGVKVSAVIPARYESTRLPGKPLIDIVGKSLIQRVYEQVQQCTAIQQIIVATDDQRIVDHVSTWSGNAVMTRQHHSGTDRVAEVARSIDSDIVVNVQGDEPLLDPQHLQALVDIMKGNSEIEIASLCSVITNGDALFDYNQVKVVTASSDDALYFSRQAIPAHRDLPYRRWLDVNSYLGHIGVYAFRRDTLLDLVALPVSALEQAESLEQLRWLEAGYRIRMVKVSGAGLGVDTEEDLDQVRRMLA